MRLSSATSKDGRATRTGRTISSRGRLAICLIASGLVHGALFAWVVLEVPTGAESGSAIERAAAPVSPAPEDDPVIQVVQIRPPGMLPSGGAASAASGATATPVTPAALEPAGEPVPISRPSLPARGLVLASAPHSPAALPDLSKGSEPAARPSRPNRGIIKRAPGFGESEGGNGRGTTGSSGFGRGGTGVTIMGPGTDCITAGLASPEGRIPLVLPNDRRRSGPSGIGVGRIGRPGR